MHQTRVGRKMQVSLPKASQGIRGESVILWCGGAIDILQLTTPKTSGCDCGRQACAKRIEKDTTGEAHCTGQYFDMWKCIDHCVRFAEICANMKCICYMISPTS